MRILVILDPPTLLKPKSDTSLALMQGALRLGHEVSMCQVEDLWLHGDEPCAESVEVRSIDTQRERAVWTRPESESHPLSHFDAVLMRKDPPYDTTYHLATLILEHARGRTLLVNDPKGLREANEKLYIFHFPELLAPTIVTQNMDRLRRFLMEQGGEMIIKPLDGYAGLGVFYLHKGDRNVNAILESMTQNGRRWVMAQRYLPAAREGDKRILLLDGEPIGAFTRVPREDDVRSNLAVGGTALRAEITAHDRALCARLAPRLRQDGLYLVGLDVIGGLLTEVNVTSPTGLRSINELDGVALEETIVEWIARAAVRPT